MIRRLREDDAGTMTLWMVGLTVLLLGFGGISVDLWRAQAERRELAAIADAAAFAGASGIDTNLFRSDGLLRLDPVVAERLSWADLAVQDGASRLEAVAVVAGPSQVSVTLEGKVDLTLLGILAPGYDPLPVRVTATAEPRVVP